MKTIEQVQFQFEQKIYETLRELDLLPDGFKLRVRLHGKVKDIKKSAAFEKNWNPETDSIRIAFEPEESTPEELPQAATSFTAHSLTTPPANQASIHAADSLSELIQALDRAESRPGYNFVSLKWFRDAALPAAGMSWANNDATRQSLLRNAIDKRLILTSKVDNPKSPQYPVTAIRLNRLIPEVKAILGTGIDDALDFHPVEIRGESLSATILRERR